MLWKLSITKLGQITFCSTTKRQGCKITHHMKQFYTHKNTVPKKKKTKQKNTCGKQQIFSVSISGIHHKAGQKHELLPYHFKRTDGSKWLTEWLTPGWCLTQWNTLRNKITVSNQIRHSLFFSDTVWMDNCSEKQANKIHCTCLTSVDQQYFYLYTQVIFHLKTKKCNEQSLSVSSPHKDENNCCIVHQES